MELATELGEAGACALEILDSAFVGGEAILEAHYRSRVRLSLDEMGVFGHGVPATWVPHGQRPLPYREVIRSCRRWWSSSPVSLSSFAPINCSQCTHCYRKMLPTVFVSCCVLLSYYYYLGSASSRSLRCRLHE
ncbi:hypothetical protein HBI56_043040 [Parastagonospora nodorum]|uniref:Uncharacterized protein n=1 Tax=Phaeosphaeria nodorum (strain SN15 / ATCC MYA-4574 / FGSC 10173) TaxID=321614 RepID=A0A7U2HWN3_PHANO|nr:hypothetical protein HBH56_240050 [Parastagonospora nodorum]QRC93134.1 hypothetical protein JI435_302560 [Parastagonospora nodorum SN15]KAH3932654.1 hypothetical protein HBH54_084370 [Parastagonospora nodorum]KAH3954722.1 hypothetical protein HBH53_010000 [Parastagonospora nodorum]KAH3986474.1 hypothetical protein HBH52_041190 [Parastagonospora nodorum]